MPHIFHGLCVFQTEEPDNVIIIIFKLFFKKIIIYFYSLQRIPWKNIYYSKEVKEHQICLYDYHISVMTSHDGDY